MKQPLSKQTKNNSKLTALVLSFSDLSQDPRVHRQIAWLSEKYNLVTAGLKAPQRSDTKFIDLSQSTSSLPTGIKGKWDLLKTRFFRKRYEEWYWNHLGMEQIAQQLISVQPDIVIANDIDAVPVALKAAKTTPVIADLHEYTPLEFEDQWRWRLLHQKYRTYLCTHYLPQVSAVTTVCQTIADTYHLLCGVKPELITNACDGFLLEPTTICSDKIRMIYHGAALPSRKVEKMVELMRFLDSRFHLDLILVPGDASYLNAIAKLSQTAPRIRLLPKVPMPTIPQFLNQYDLGVFLLEPTNFNYKYALPNKLFEFIQARLAIAVGPSPEMASIVEKHHLGVVSSDFTPKSLAKKLNALSTAQIQQFKMHAHAIAPELCSEHNKEHFLQIVNRELLNQQQPQTVSSSDQN